MGGHVHLNPLLPLRGFPSFGPILDLGPEALWLPSKVSTLRAQILKNFKILKFSSELEIFKRATHQTPIFCGEFWRSGLKLSSDLEIFKRD